MKNYTPSQLLAWFQVTYPNRVKELKECTHHYGENINPFHVEGDCWSHTMLVFSEMIKVCKENDIPEGSEYFKLLLVCALCHDLGKPYCREEVPEKQKVRFHSHESVSRVYAIGVAKELYEQGYLDNKSDVVLVSVIVGMHSVLFNMVQEGKFEIETCRKTFKHRGNILTLCVLMSLADSRGRFFLKDDNSRGEFEEYVYAIYDDLSKNSELYYSKPNSLIDDKPKLTLLVGSPLSGKTTFISDSDLEKNSVIVSRDSLMMSMSKEMGFDLTYSEVWKKFTELELHEQVDEKLNNIFSSLVREGKNIVIDMTNLSRKRRNKFLSQVGKKYQKRAFVFLTDIEELEKRNVDRNKQQGKYISTELILNMNKSYSEPNYSEFDEILYVTYLED